MVDVGEGRHDPNGGGRGRGAHGAGHAGGNPRWRRAQGRRAGRRASPASRPPSARRISIPLCHTLLLTKVAVDFTVDEAASRVTISATVRCNGQTGVEMEALTAVSVAALTIYDMAKALDKAMVIENIRLLEKAGGKSGDWRREDA